MKILTKSPADVIAHFKNPKLVGKAEIFTCKELAEFCGVALSTVYGWNERKNGPPYVYISTALIRYRKNDVIKWIENLPTNGN